MLSTLHSEQIQMIKNIINANIEQNKILEAELTRLEKLVPELTINFNKKVTLRYRTEYANHYEDKKVGITGITINDNMRQLMGLLFADDKGSYIYDYIYGTMAYDYSIQYDILRITRALYLRATNTTEQERLRDVYNTISAKDTSVVDFINAKVLTKENVDSMTKFYKKCTICPVDRPKLDKQLAVLSFIIDNNLTVSTDTMHKEIIAEIKKWLDQSYTCWHTIEKSE